MSSLYFAVFHAISFTTPYGVTTLTQPKLLGVPRISEHTKRNETFLMFYPQRFRYVYVTIVTRFVKLKAQ